MLKTGKIKNEKFAFSHAWFSGISWLRNYVKLRVPGPYNPYNI